MLLKKFLVISIITPSYNQGRFIDKTIDSVISQKGDFMIDYVLVDGQSTDDTINIIKKYEKKIKSREIDFKCSGITFRWISEKDDGPVDALNKGFKLMTGDICTWLNSDDYYVSDAVFEKVINEFNNDNSLKVITADGIFVDKDGVEIGKHYVKKINTKELIYLDYHILQPSTFFKKDLIDKYYLNEKYKCSFDMDLFSRMIVNNEKYKKIDDYWSTFRMWGNNITSQKHWRRFYEAVQITYYFSKNPLWFFVSVVYKFHEMVFKGIIINKFSAEAYIRRIFDKYFYYLRHISYRIITGQGYRQG